MLKKILSSAVIVLVMNFATVPSIFAKSKESEFAEKVKTEITKLGTGQHAKIKVKLKDGTKIKGYINTYEFYVSDLEVWENDS